MKFLRPSRSLQFILATMLVLIGTQSLMAGVTFQQAKQYAAGTFPTAVAIGDLNGDGWADMVVANRGTAQGTRGSISLLINNADGTFHHGLNYDRGGIFYSVAVGDFNHDGKLDVAAANQKTSTVDLLLGNGNGTLGAPTSFAANGDEDLRFVTVGDLNGDGNPDLIVADGCIQQPCPASALGVFLGNGDGTFQAMVTYSTNQKGVYTPVVVDFNNDGKLDVAAGTDSGIVVFAGKGDGTLAAPLFLNSKLSYTSVATGEFDSNANADLAVVNFGVLGGNPGSLGILLGDGTGKFSGSRAGSIKHPLFVAAADLDGDGNSDLVVKGGADNNVYVLIGNGDSTFQPAQFYNVHTPRGSVAIGDLNKDGHPDIVAAGTESEVEVLLSAGP
jgi:hypothetical protein